MPNLEPKHRVFVPVVMSEARSSPRPMDDDDDRNPGPRPDFIPAIYIDMKRCIGCNACSLACKQENDVEIGQRWAEVYGTETGGYPDVKTRVMPMMCHHCEDAPCKAKCDKLGHNAIIRRPDGIVYVDANLCQGKDCQACVAVCPFRAIFFSAEKNTAEKCHFCMHRIDAGLQPACVITCLTLTREYGDHHALLAKYDEAEEMTDEWGQVKLLYGNMGDKPEHGDDSPTHSYPDPAPCHDD